MLQALDGSYQVQPVTILHTLSCRQAPSRVQQQAVSRSCKSRVSQKKPGKTGKLVLMMLLLVCR